MVVLIGFQWFPPPAWFFFTLTGLVPFVGDPPVKKSGTGENHHVVVFTGSLWFHLSSVPPPCGLLRWIGVLWGAMRRGWSCMGGAGFVTGRGEPAAGMLPTMQITVILQGITLIFFLPFS